MATIGYVSDLGPVNRHGRIETRGLDLYAVVETRADGRTPASLGNWGSPFDNLEEAVAARDEANRHYRSVGRTFAVAHAHLTSWEMIP